MSDSTPTEIRVGNCIEEMQDMDADTVHAVVTDPPYGLAFMGRTWDQFEPKEYQEWCEEWATEALRVLKPGGHLIAFSGNRTHHRLFSAVEDAGFEVRDTLTYHYGTGFPKGSDVGKHIDRYYDAEDEREVVGKANHYDGSERTPNDPSEGSTTYADSRKGNSYDITAPATSEAEKWDGWRSQLKPSTEFAVLARAPMSESAVYRNVLEHGTGALNIDRTRIPLPDEEGERTKYNKRATGDPGNSLQGSVDGSLNGNTGIGSTTEGRYPANLLLDGVAARMLDEQSGECGDLVPEPHRKDSIKDGGVYQNDRGRGEDTYYSDSGGASRFFYTAKASKSERTIDGQLDNEHPTVKPLDLMEHLVTLVTAPGQRVLDPFAGSGTTIMACRRLGREGIGIEKSEEHAELARKRVELAHELETDHVPATESDTDEADGGPATLESFGDDD